MSKSTNRKETTVKTAQRTDVHRPSTMDPADYENIGDYDTHDEEGYFYMTPEATELHNSGAIDYFGDGRGRCDHCGHPGTRRFVMYLHHPTQKIVCVGWDCAVKLGAENLSQLQMKKRGEANRRRALVIAWRAENADNEAVWNFLNEQLDNGNHGWNGFYFDLLHKLNRYGSLSEKQVAAALRSRDRDAEHAAKREAEKADASPVITGKVTITGTILSTKWQDSAYGSTLKMLVRDDRGFKVWGTCPASLDCSGVTAEKGDRVTFTATVEASRDDETFGFFKRPTGAERVA
jgi:hypothetical protein